MSLEHYQNPSRDFLSDQAINQVSSKTIVRVQRTITQRDLDAIVESRSIQARAYVGLTKLDTAGMLSEAAADRLFLLARRIGDNAAETPWAVEEYKAILRSFAAVADHVIQRQARD